MEGEIVALHEGKSIKPPINKLKQHKHVNIKQDDRDYKLINI